MPTSISFDSDSAWISQDIELSGSEYTIKSYLNERINPPRFYIDLYQEDTPLKLGIKLLGDKDLTSWYILEEFSEGVLILIRFNPDLSITPTKGNIGFGKDFELYYYTFEELEAL